MPQASCPVDSCVSEVTAGSLTTIAPARQVNHATGKQHVERFQVQTAGGRELDLSRKDAQRRDGLLWLSLSLQPTGGPRWVDFAEIAAGVMTGRPQRRPDKHNLTPQLHTEDKRGQ